MGPCGPGYSEKGINSFRGRLLYAVCCILYAVFTSATFLFREWSMEPAGKKEKLQTGIPDF